MTLEAFYHLLTEDADVQALVSGRVHYHQRPQGQTQRAVILQLITETFPHHMQGGAGCAFGVARLNCLGNSPLVAGELADAVREAIDGFVGDVGVAANPPGFRFARVLVQTSGEIPRDIPAGQAGPNVFGFYLDADFLLNPYPLES